MNKIFTAIATLLMISSYSAIKAQNSPIIIWGTGLDGSVLQQSAIYAVAPEGLVLEAPKDINGTNLPIQINWRGGGYIPFKILGNGNVGIGTTTPNEKLSVNGKIRAQEIKVETANWPDYVFDHDYKILGLKELEEYIKVNNHLPEMPSAKEVEKNGLELGEMNKLLLKKVEELILIVIEQNKRILKLENK